MASNSDQALTFVEGELASYRIENDLLARELVLTRRTIRILPYSAADNASEPMLKPIPVPRPQCADADLYCCVDRCETGEKLIHLAGWAFSPRIDCSAGRITIILEGLDGAFIVQPHRMLRPDVAGVYARTDFGEALPRIPPPAPTSPNAALTVGSAGPGSGRGNLTK